MKKSLITPAVAFAVAASLVAAPAVAAQTPDEIDQTVATRGQLDEIVTAEVSRTYSAVNTTIRDVTAGTVRTIITGPGIIAGLVGPLVRAALAQSIGAYLHDSRLNPLIDAAVASVADSELLSAMMTPQFTQSVLRRTADDVIAQINDALGLADSGASTAASIVARVWNAQLASVGTAPTKVKSDLGSPPYALGLGVNTSYYDYTVTAWNQRRLLLVTVNDTPSQIQVTGWNTGNIRLLTKGAAAAGSGLMAARTALTLATLNYPAILIDAGRRAFEAEIAPYTESVLGAVKTVVLASLQEGLAGIGVAVALNPADSWSAIAAQIAQALRERAGQALDAALASLPSVPVLGIPSSTFFAALTSFARAGAGYVTSWLGQIDWLSLFRGGASNAPSGPSLSVRFSKDAVVNTETPAVTIVARDDNGVVLPAAELGATVSYSYGDSCEFPAGEAPARRTCTVTVDYDGMTAQDSVEVFDPSALNGPIEGQAIPGAKLTATSPDGWPSISRSWTRNGRQFSTASSYKLPSSEKLGNAIVVNRTLKYKGLTITGSSPALTVALGSADSIKIEVAERAIANAGGVTLTAVAKDEYKNVIPDGATGTSYTYSLGEGCSFPAGEAPSRRTCTITGTFEGVSGTATVEVFDPSALTAPIDGVATPGSTLRAVAPEGWPSVTREWTRNGKKFSTASSYKLPSSEKTGNVIELTQSLKYQGLTISGTSPEVAVALGAPATVKLTPATKAISNVGGVVVVAEVKDALGNVIPDGATGTSYTYSLGEGCSFPAGEAPSRRTCTITGTFEGVSGTATVEVFDPSALTAPIDGVATPGSTLRAVAPEGWPSVTREWTRNGKKFSTASSYKLPSSEKEGNVIELTQTLKYQGLTISATAPTLVVTR